MGYILNKKTTTNKRIRKNKEWWEYNQKQEWKKCNSYAIWKTDSSNELNDDFNGKKNYFYIDILFTRKYDGTHSMEEKSVRTKMVTLKHA